MVEKKMKKLSKKSIDYVMVEVFKKHSLEDQTIILNTLKQGKKLDITKLTEAGRKTLFSFGMSILIILNAGLEIIKLLEKVKEKRG